MARITFERVRLKGTRYWREDGKRRQETRWFEQTINPWNLNADGTPKTRDQIRAELEMERRKWMLAKGAPDGD